MMATLLDQYSNLCDEVETFMRDENIDLRCHGSDGAGWVDRKKTIISRIEVLVLQIRNESAGQTADLQAHRESRELVMKKLLKLLLLSRENEHLLLKNSLPQRPAPTLPTANFSAVRGAYQSNR